MSSFFITIREYIKQLDAWKIVLKEYCPALLNAPDRICAFDTVSQCDN